MEIDREFNKEADKQKFTETFYSEPQLQQESDKKSYTKIAGILLIIAGILGIVNWIQIFLLDATTLGSFMDISQIQELNPSITYEQLLGLLKTCAIIGIIVSIFPILGGLLAIQKKLYYIALATSIIGLFSIGFMFTSSILSLIGLILLIMSKQSFQ
ncbi:MAG: hypothetical protein JSU91_03695 [Thermoplasmatales archaeon]|nr:MAG: hypothetical protein JSU91_03695 [Thermoplasmatales archaeon]